MSESAKEFFDGCKLITPLPTDTEKALETASAIITLLVQYLKSPSLQAEKEALKALGENAERWVKIYVVPPPAKDKDHE